MQQLGHVPVVPHGSAQTVMGPSPCTMFPQMPQYGRVPLDDGDLGPAWAFDVWLSPLIAEDTCGEA